MNYSREDLEDLKVLSRCKLHLKKIKNDLGNKTGYNKKQRFWNNDELDYIINNWGIVTPYEMMQKFKVTKYQLLTIKERLGLKNWLLYSKYITLCNLYGKKEKHYSNYVWYEYLMTKYNAPIETIKVWNNDIKVIELSKFYDWFNGKLHLLDFYYADVSLFKNAPDWFKEKLRAHALAFEYANKRPWTKTEEIELIEMINKGCGYREISIALKRSGKAVKRRVYDLKLPKPKKAYNHINWTEEEIEKVKELYLKGYKPCIIQEHLERSELAIMTILERNNYFGMEIIKFRK